LKNVKLERLEQKLFPFAKGMHSLPPQKDFLVDFGGITRSVEIVRRVRAKRYRLSINAQGQLRLTIPRGGNLPAGLEFGRSKSAWVSQKLSHLLNRGQSSCDKMMESGQVLLGGEVVAFTIGAATRGQIAISVGEVSVHVYAGTRNAGQLLAAALWVHASRVLPQRLADLAKACGCQIGRVAVRNQRGRWGSCAASGNISLNWRLVQMPHGVADYIMVHELMHTREMSHSQKFWEHVKAHFPDYEEAERWLKKNRGMLLP
jgi:predicted metal-dependent hydrolase